MKPTNGLGLALLMGVMGVGAGYFLRTRLEPSAPARRAPEAGAVRTVIKGTPPTYVAVTNEFKWAQIESEDYRTYIARLRAIGCQIGRAHV